MTQQEAIAATDAISGTIKLFDLDACMLIDLGSTHSFMAYSLASRLDKPMDSLDVDLSVATPLGDSITTRDVILNCPYPLERIRFLQTWYHWRLEILTSSWGWIACPSIELQ